MGFVGYALTSLRPVLVELIDEADRCRNSLNALKDVISFMLKENLRRIFALALSVSSDVLVESCDMMDLFAFSVKLVDWRSVARLFCSTIVSSLCGTCHCCFSLKAPDIIGTGINGLSLRGVGILFELRLSVDHSGALYIESCMLRLDLAESGCRPSCRSESLRFRGFMTESGLDKPPTASP
jgi:hypothetical protein